MEEAKCQNMYDVSGMGAGCLGDARLRRKSISRLGAPQQSRIHQKKRCETAALNTLAMIFLGLIHDWKPKLWYCATAASNCTETISVHIASDPRLRKGEGWSRHTRIQKHGLGRDSEEDSEGR